MGRNLELDITRQCVDLERNKTTCYAGSMDQNVSAYTPTLGGSSSSEAVNQLPLLAALSCALDAPGEGSGFEVMQSKFDMSYNIVADEDFLTSEQAETGFKVAANETIVFRRNELPIHPLHENDRRALRLSAEDLVGDPALCEPTLR